MILHGVRHRIELLERRMVTDPITLTFADGSTRTLRGSTQHWRALTAAMFARDSAEAAGLPVPGDCKSTTMLTELTWLAECVEITGTNSQPFYLTKALIGYNDEGSEVEVK
jgi:hypothetical protein